VLRPVNDDPRWIAYIKISVHRTVGLHQNKHISGRLMMKPRPIIPILMMLAPVLCSSWVGPQDERRPRLNNQLNEAPPAARLPRPPRCSEPSAIRLAPRDKWLTPLPNDTFLQHILRHLGAHFEQEFMSVSNRSGQVEREAFGPTYAFDANLRRMVDAMNLSGYDPEAASLNLEVQKIFKRVLLQQASCLVKFRWKDEGLLTWPRYIKHGVRLNYFCYYFLHFPFPLLLRVRLSYTTLSSPCAPTPDLFDSEARPPTADVSSD
jgi:hypothetical protein